MTIGPDIEGDKIGDYETGLGMRVYDILHGDNVQGESQMKHYDNLPVSFLSGSTATLDTIEWAEASNNRDHLFVCISSGDALLVYDISNPMDEIKLVTRVEISCQRATYRDYHLIDFQQDGEWYTTLIDPFNSQNRLLYYKTTTADWLRLGSYFMTYDNHDDGLGQVVNTRNNMLTIMTMHCASTLCDRSHGESIYIVRNDWENANPILVAKLKLELSPGSFSRDVACLDNGLCGISNTWDGVTVISTTDEKVRVELKKKDEENF